MELVAMVGDKMRQNADKSRQKMLDTALDMAKKCT